ncbi:N-glycosylation protein-domain-containing protein [Limtongia smithiae]|uniref:N-glycosylation protein-domain-containing protein n=1 Tax=Limtongia smithiae TaxID=1125753 RepID=UPI0034CFE5BB
MARPRPATAAGAPVHGRSSRESTSGGTRIDTSARLAAGSVNGTRTPSHWQQPPPAAAYSAPPPLPSATATSSSASMFGNPRPYARRRDPLLDANTDTEYVQSSDYTDDEGGISDAVIDSDDGLRGPADNTHGTTSRRQQLREHQEVFRLFLQHQRDQLMTQLTQTVPYPLFTDYSIPQDGRVPPPTPPQPSQLGTALSSNDLSASTPASRLASSRSSPVPVVSERSLKGLIGPARRLAHVICKALSLPPGVYGAWMCLREAWKAQHENNDSARSIELMLAALWGGVSAYLSFAFIDGLMLRWLVMYSSPGTIVRLLSINTLMAALTRIILSIFAADPVHLLPTWILIACILTAAYAIQSFVTSNIAIEPRTRRVDLYHIAVFAVVPVGLASFITLMGLIRSLMIIRSGDHVTLE